MYIHLRICNLYAGFVEAHFELSVEKASALEYVAFVDFGDELEHDAGIGEFVDSEVTDVSDEYFGIAVLDLIEYGGDLFFDVFKVEGVGYAYRREGDGSSFGTDLS